MITRGADRTVSHAMSAAPMGACVSMERVKSKVNVKLGILSLFVKIIIIRIAATGTSAPLI